MSIILQAGTNFSFTRTNPLISELVVGFGWNVIQGNGPQIDLVPSAIMSTQEHKAVSDEHFVFFNQLSTPDDSVRYVDSGDAEQIEVSLKSVPAEVDTIVFVVYVDPDVRQPGNYGSVRNAYIRVADKDGSELVRFNVPQQSSEINALTFGEIYRHNNEWKFRAVGQGYADGISGVAKDYQVSL